MRSQHLAGIQCVTKLKVYLNAAERKERELDTEEGGRGVYSPLQPVLQRVEEEFCHCNLLCI